LENVYATLVLISFVLFLVGVVSPKKSLFWDKKAPTRKKSALIYGGGLFLSLVLLGSSVDPKKNLKGNTASAATDAPTEAPVEKPLSEADKKKLTVDYEAKYKAQAAQEAKERADQTIKAPELVSVYQENEVKADKAFKGKTFYVTGTIEDIKKDITDDIYVTLEGDGVLRQVQCYFDNEDIAADFRKGQRVTFKGKCDGLMMNVLMKDCTLVVD
jgi:hypothetical protein